MAGNARKIALDILSRLDKNRATLDSTLDAVTGLNLPLERRDRALLNALVYGVLRWRGRLDYIIGHFSRTKLKKIDPAILNILRLGLLQILYLDRIPVSAAVNTSVEMAKSVAQSWVANYVNGVLRTSAREHAGVPFPSRRKTPVFALAVEKSFPEWLIKRWLKRFGLEETRSLCDAINSIPPITLRTNTLKTNREALLESIKGDVYSVRPTLVSETGLSCLKPDCVLSEMSTFKRGGFQVQDEAAQLVSSLMAPQPGETVLDACAGLGGKTGHIAQLMKNSGTLIAADKDSEKLSRLESEMDRLGVTMVRTLCHDLKYQMSETHSKSFDRVLLDAPCSGLGVLRRNPDTKWSSSEKDLKKSGQRQLTLLENLSSLVKPSGVMTYAVCSIEPEENEAVILSFLKKHEEFVIDRITKGLSQKASALIDPEGYLRTFPHRDDMDGFFAVRLKRSAG